jgi:pimeloyl-ACP methyl ester carboxylesterase
MRRARLAEEAALPPDGPPVPPWRGRRMDLRRVGLYVRDTPPTAANTEPALYVHGLGGSSLNFTDVAGLLSARLDGMAVDLPGFGYSDPMRRYSIRAFAESVVELIEHNGNGPVHLVGNSLGGAIGVRVAAMRPDLVRTLVLISPAMPFLDARKSVHGRMVPLLALPRVDRIAAWKMTAIEPELMAAEILRACWAHPDQIPPERLDEAVSEVRRRNEVPHFASAYTGALRSLVWSFIRAQLPGAGSMWSLARRVRVPTLVVGGLRDQLVDIYVAPKVARTIPDARLLLLPDVGHVAQMEVPRVVARAILGLLDSLDDAGEGPVRVSRAGASPANESRAGKRPDDESRSAERPARVNPAVLGTAPVSPAVGVAEGEDKVTEAEDGFTGAQDEFSGADERESRGRARETR